MATYVVSDLHGQYGIFLKGLDRIGFSDKDTLFVIGDVIDRGADGIELLKHIKKKRNMELLLGNHEVMMLGSVDPNGENECNGEHSEIWLYYNGGQATYEKYVSLSIKERQSLLMWLNRCYIMKIIEINGRKICLTHSYYHKNLENKMYFETDHELVWDVVWTSMFRDDDDTHGDNIYKNYDYQFIIGHVPVQKAAFRHGRSDDYNRLCIYEYGNVKDIDGGCAMGDIPGLNNGAIFLRLEDMKEIPVLMSE